MLKKKKIRRYWRISLTLSFLIILLYGVSFWSSHDSMKIDSVVVTGHKYVSENVVLEKYEEGVSKKVLFFISKKNFIFLPRDVISTKIEQELSVSSAFVHIGDDINTVEIEIIEYDPFALWCDTDCYLVNEKGLAFFNAPEIVIEDLVKVKRETEGDILGQSYVDEKLFKNFVTTIDLLKRINIGIREISTTDLETFVFKTKAGPELHLDKRDNPLEVVNNLKTTLEQESINENQFKNLEYIDLRFEGKVYYKIR
jgi:cell division septal protein FtsQ